jgi:transposase
MTTMADSQVLVTVGVDTHADNHVAAALDQLGRELGTLTLSTTTRGFHELGEWASEFGVMIRSGSRGPAAGARG